MTDPTTTIAADREAPNLAVDIIPDYTQGTFTVGVSELDGLDLLAWGDGEDAWHNVICDVVSVHTQRGARRADGLLTRAEVGTCSVVLRDPERRFDPTTNSEAVHPGTPFRVRAWDVGPGGQPWEEVLFTGRIGSGKDGIRIVYSATGAPTVTILAVDRIGPLAAWEATGRPEPGVGSGDDLLNRVNRVLAELSWPSDVLADDVDAAYAATLASNTLTSAWDVLADAVEAELGRLWVDRQDRIVVRSRGSELSGPVRGTMSDVHDEIVDGTVHLCYADASIVYGTELLADRAIGGRRIPRDPDDDTAVPVITAQVDDDYSQGRYGVSVVKRLALELETDAQLLPWAQTVVLAGTEPELRVDSVTPAPWNAPASWQQVAASDIGDRWSFRQHPEIGPTVAMTLGLLGIEHNITPERWDTTWVTEKAPTPGDNNPSGWFTLDVSSLDDGDLLAPVGGTVTVT